MHAFKRSKGIADHGESDIPESKRVRSAMLSGSARTRLLPLIACDIVRTEIHIESNRGQRPSEPMVDSHILA